MTRLVPADIGHINTGWTAYEEEFKAASGLRLWDLAARCAGAEAPLFDRPLVGVVSIGYGEGVIGGFAESLASIAAHLGFPVIMAERKNFAGWAEVMARGVAIVFCSDDDFFGAFNLGSGRVSENSRATGEAYAEMLGAMAGGLTEREAHVVGAGPVGAAGAARLVRLGARVVIHDLDESKANRLAAALQSPSARAAEAGELISAQKKGGLFLQAAPCADALDWAALDPAASIVSHPAVPLGLPEADHPKWRGRLWHDPLELGSAAMLAQALL